MASRRMESDFIIRTCYGNRCGDCGRIFTADNPACCDGGFIDIMPDGSLVEETGDPTSWDPPGVVARISTEGACRACCHGKKTQKPGGYCPPNQ